MKVKVLFLDVDGVLNSAQWFKQNRSAEGDYPGLRSIDPEAVKRVLRVIDTTGAVIVLSSTWRMLDDYVDALVKAGIPIADMTPRIASANRADEILAWLEPHVNDVEKIAIVDDDDDAGDNGLRHRFVKTNWEVGIQEQDAQALIMLLS